MYIDRTMCETITASRRDYNCNFSQSPMELSLLTTSGKSGASKQPIRSAILHRLKPLFRMTVGKSSEANTNTTQVVPTKHLMMK